MGTPPYTIQTTDTVRAALLTKSTGNDSDVYTKLDPANAIGAYSDLPTRLTAMDALIASAGTGTAMIITGTSAARLAYTTIVNMLLWAEYDTNKYYRQVTGTTQWVEMVDAANDQSISGVKTFTSVAVTGIATLSGTVNASGPVAFTSTLSSTQPATVGNPTTRSHAINLNVGIVWSQAF